MQVRDSPHFIYRLTPGLLLFAFTATAASATAHRKTQAPLEEFNLVPYPQRVTIKPGTLTITSLPAIHFLSGAGAKEILGQEQLSSFFHKRIASAETAKRVRIELGSLENRQNVSSWLNSEETTVLRGLSSQAYILRIDSSQIAIIGRTELGTLYGVQTLIQMLSQSQPEMRLPLLEIEDYPEVPDRYVDVTFSWYAHYGAIDIGFGTQLWGEDQWRWFIDWCLAHKINGVDLCIYGYWPFTFQKYPESTLTNIPIKTYDPKNGKVTIVRMSHPNIEREFLPALIRYAQERGIRVNAYIGLNTFDGGYAKEHPQSQVFAGKTYALDLSNPAARQYLRDSLRRTMQMGFDGITFEMIEFPSSVCTNSECISKYWAGNDIVPNSVPKLTPLPVRIRADADLLNDLYKVIADEKPRADVGLIYHRIVEMYGWGPGTLEAFRQFRAMIPKEVYFLQGPRAPRDGTIEGSEFEKWVNIAERETYRHSDNIGGDAAFYTRRLYINNDPATRGDQPVASLEWEIAQHRAAARVHLHGATGYAFEWYGDEIYPLILAQYGWRSSGPEGVSDHGFLEYASQSMYGKKVGTLVAEALALSPPPMDRYTPAWEQPARDAVKYAQQALDEYSGSEPQYRMSLEQIRTATLRTVGLYELEELEDTAGKVTGEQKTKLLQQALAKAEQVGDLILSGKPRVNYLDCYGEHGFRIFATIKSLSDELGLKVQDKFVVPKDN
ncbi:MAG: glycoside hydrolase family 20 zincin-like fold domain-containing protein [Acidobacteriaceae bacterium]